MANVTTNILLYGQHAFKASMSSSIGHAHNGEVTSDSARSGCERVGGTKERCRGICLSIKDIPIKFRIQLTATSLDGVTAFPYHGADGAAQHIC